MKRMRGMVSGMTVLLCLCTVLLCSGCAGDPAQRDNPSSQSTKQTGENTATATGTYQGRTITMTYGLRTDIKINNTVTSPFSKGYTAVCEMEQGKDRFCYRDAQGKILNDTYYTFAYPFQSDGRALVSDGDDHWYTIDTQGQKVGDAQAPAEQGPTIYETNGLFGLKDGKGQTLTEAKFSFISGTSLSSNYAVLDKADHPNVLISPRGEIQMTLPDDCVAARTAGDRVICAYNRDDDRVYRLLNRAGELLNDRYFSAIGGFEDGLAPVTLNGKIGLMDSEGNVVIEPSLPFDDANPIDPALSEGKIVGSLNTKLIVVKVDRS